jgi:hypothetical protein
LRKIYDFDLVKYLESIAQKGQSRRRCLQNTSLKADADILSHLARQIP